MEFEFQKNEVIDSLDKVPEQFRGFYAEGEGGFQLNENFKPTASAIDGLNRSLKAARRDADEARKSRPDVSGYKQVAEILGLEGDEAIAPENLRAAVEKVLSESKEGKVNWDKMKQTLENGFRNQLQAKDGEIQTMSKTLEKYLVTTAAVQSIAAAKGVPDLLLPHIQARTKVVKEGNEYVVRVIDEAGDPRGNASGGFMTVEDLVKEMKASPVFGRAFESEAPSGSGMAPGTGQRRPAPQNQEMTPTQRIAAGLAKRR